MIKDKRYITSKSTLLYIKTAIEGVLVRKIRNVPDAYCITCETETALNDYLHELNISHAEKEQIKSS